MDSAERKQGPGWGAGESPSSSLEAPTMSSESWSFRELGGKCQEIQVYPLFFDTLIKLLGEKDML